MIELVWDTARIGTATAPSGATLAVGDRSPFSPDDLLAAAVAGCLMRTFVLLAGEAGAPILSFAATAHAPDRHECDAAPVVVHVYVMAPAGTDTRTLADLVARSVERSPVVRRLAIRPVVTSDIRVLCHSDRPAS